MIHVQISLGNDLKATVTGEDVKKVIKEAAFFSELPAMCPICDLPVAFMYRNPGSYDYYGMRCSGSPAHECNFGQHQEGNTFFYKGKDSWGDAYKKSESGGRQEGAPEAAPPPTEDDIPF